MGLHGDKEFPSLVSEGIILLYVDWLCLTSHVVEKEDPKADGNGKKDQKNSQIHLKPSPQGEAKQEKEVWAGERKL